MPGGSFRTILLASFSLHTANALADGSTAGINMWNAAEAGQMTYNEALFGNGKVVNSEFGKADQALGRADRLAALGDQIGRDRGALLKQLANLDRRNFPSAAEREQVRSALLSQAYEPPKEFRDATGSLGLRTFNDLNKKGPEVLARLENDMQKNVDAFQQARDRAQKGAEAGKQFTQLEQKMESLRGRMESMPSVRGAANPSSATTGGAVAVAAAESQELASGLTRAKFSSPAIPGERALAAGKEKSVNAEATLQPGHLGPRGARGPSLRDQLRAALAAAKGRGDQAGAARIEGELARAEKEDVNKLEGAARALASITGGEKEPPGTEPFAMGGAAGDVSRIVHAFEHSSGEAADEISLFERVKKRHDACVVGRRVGG